VSEFKKGDRVWVRATVGNADADRPGWFNFWFTGNNGVYLPASDCRPANKDQDDHLFGFKVGDEVVSRCGRKGVVEAIDLIEGYPITVRHSIREQVSYLVCDVRHRGDDHPGGFDVGDRVVVIDRDSEFEGIDGEVDSVQGEMITLSIHGGFLKIDAKSQSLKKVERQAETKDSKSAPRGPSSVFWL
jgi:preprotein translocase subunit YajC